ncbi:MAG: hypothetical protein CL858_28695 [Cupriavidus sp.]|nr:hypothetical protein ADL19_30985 [Streptomyces purpurogeneiscleroticus]MBP32377.1 hypothetical protein [Methylobacterium sp.]MBU69363.1 hypothetical protein [Cupriavidus sp.]
MSGGGRSDRRAGLPDATMRPSSRTVLGCLILALLIGGVGIGLRRAVTVTPVDDAFRAVLRAYAAPDAAGGTQQHD